MRPFHIPRLPPGMLEEIEPRLAEDGTKVRRFRMKGTDWIGEEIKPTLIRQELVKVEPMAAPAGSIFFLDFEMPKTP